MQPIKYLCERMFQVRVSLMKTVQSSAFWALVMAQLAAEWSLHMLVFVVPVFLQAVLRINIHTFFVSREKFPQLFRYTKTQYVFTVSNQTGSVNISGI
jgi:hypothetical protein